MSLASTRVASLNAQTLAQTQTATQTQTPPRTETRIQPQPGQNPLPTLTTARAVHALSMTEAARGYNIHLHGVILYYDPYLDYPQPILMVADPTGNIFVKLPLKASPNLKAGELVEVRGKSVPGGFAPDVDRPQIRVLEQSHLPAAAPLRSLTELLRGSEDAPWVEMRGVIHAVRETDHNVLLKVAASDGIFSAVTVKEPGVAYDRLVNQRVTFRGVACSLFNKRRQIVGIQLRFPSLSMMKVEDQAPESPYDLPVSKIGNLLSYSPGRVLDRLVHLRGVVTLFWPGRMLCVQDAGDGLCAETAQTTPLALGQTADIVGFPKIGDYTPTLEDASYRAALTSGQVSVTVAEPGQPLRWEFDAQPVALEGRLVGQNRGAEDPSILVSSGNVIYSVILPSSADARQLLQLEDGSRLRITGICSVRPGMSGATNSDGYKVARFFRILLRSADDIVVLQRPSWWNATHTLRVLAGALIVTSCALGWVLILTGRLGHQARLLQFQATHDGLTGLWNRKAILELLSRDAALAGRSQSTVGIVMLDADHFKNVNDTYGHPAGDIVLRAISERIRQSVRSTELIGRYGGEEFLIVLPNSNWEQVAIVAERIRTTIAQKPIRVEEIELSLTVSIGTSILVPPLDSPKDSLAAADRALYTSKKAGRNRVTAAQPIPMSDRTSAFG